MSFTIVFDTVIPTVAWKIDPAVTYNKSDLSATAQRLVTNIVWATGASGPNHVVYSAGGGANVAAEAVNYLLHHNYTQDDIRPHFTIIQHGRNNWQNQYEEHTRGITDVYTLPLDNQNDNLNTAFTATFKPVATGAWFGSETNEALLVAFGRMSFNPTSAAYEPGVDASDSGSFTFGMESTISELLPNRMPNGGYLKQGAAYQLYWYDQFNAQHERVGYVSFDHGDIERIFDGNGYFSDPSASLLNQSTNDEDYLLPETI